MGILIKFLNSCFVFGWLPSFFPNTGTGIVETAFCLPSLPLKHKEASESKQWNLLGEERSGVGGAGTGSAGGIKEAAAGSWGQAAEDLEAPQHPSESVPGPCVCVRDPGKGPLVVMERAVRY